MDEVIKYKIKKVLITFFALVFMIVVLIFIFIELNKAKLVIITEENADIYATQERGAEMVRVGTTKATFKTNSENVVYIEVRSGAAATHTSAEVKRRQTVEVSVDLKEPSSPEKISEGPLSYMHVQGDFVYGINPNTRNFSFRSTKGKGIAPVSFASLPYARKADWIDNKNFVYSSYGRGVGNVISGRNYMFVEQVSHNTKTFLDYAKAPNRPIVLLSEDGLYSTSSFRSDDFKQIAPFDFVGSQSMFADSENIYLAIKQFGDEGEGAMPVTTSSVLRIFNYQGNNLKNFDLPLDQEVMRVINIDSKGVYAVLTDSQLLLIDKETGDHQNIPSYSIEARDIVELNGKIYTLNSNGLWHVDLSTNNQYLIASFPEHQLYTSGSLLVRSGEIFFSTEQDMDVLRADSSMTGSGIYKVKFSP